MAYDDNLYQNPGPSLVGALGEFALFAGVEYGHARTTRALAGARAPGVGHSPLGWWRDRSRRREATRASKEIWQSFTAGKGRKFRDRWASARAVGSNPSYWATRPAATTTGSVTEKAAGRMATGRAVAGLARPVLGVARGYMIWGTLAQAGIEMAATGVGELKRFGERLRSKIPESSVGWRDMAVREQAFTMRQASLMALHMSQSGARASLGSEASYLHS